MAKIIFLGSSNAIPHKQHENTHFVIVGKERVVLVDCVSNPILRLEQAGVDFNDLTDLIATHFHPDHVSGIPLLLMDLWLMGRTRPLAVHGLSYTLDRLEAMMDLYDWKKWPDFFPVSFVRLPGDEMTPVLESADFKVTASPVKHLIPTIGLRAEFKSGKIFAYSCDTEPCAQVVRLAANADALVHESSGATLGHSSAAQAAEVATRANADRLYLIHYPTGEFETADILSEARSHFRGTVCLVEDFMTLEF